MDFLQWKDIASRSIKVVFAGAVMASVLLVIMTGVSDYLGETIIASIVMIVLGALLGIGTFIGVVFVTRA